PRRRQTWEAGETPQGSGSADPYAEGFPHFEDYIADLFAERPGRGRAGEVGSAPRADAHQPPAPAAGPVAATPAPPPPVRAATDLETVVDLTPDQALRGERLELELGDGTVVELRTPPLAGDGWRLRLAGVGPGGGDHFLHLRVRTAEGLRIDGLRVLYLLEISPAQAALGCRAAIPTLDGPVRLTVPPCCSSGRQLRLRRRGLRWHDQCGDQLVEVRIVLPQRLDEAETALYERLDELAEAHAGID
ncbi:MAG: DnaJ C-terminal domain-containing protein, partial [Synechococcaceae cyanobacterium]|nr:DnaJ C-terminal domain-containing protein [Synechococcaceae cyanobacterium]